MNKQISFKVHWFFWRNMLWKPIHVHKSLYVAEMAGNDGEQHEIKGKLCGLDKQRFKSKHSPSEWSALEDTGCCMGPRFSSVPRCHLS